MNRDILTWLGCSGSLALVLLTVNPAKADTAPLRELVFEAPIANSVQGVDPSVAINTVDCGCASEDAASSLNFDDTAGDLAIDTFGCDCAGCRNLTRQLLLQGSLPLPL